MFEKTDDFLCVNFYRKLERNEKSISGSYSQGIWITSSDVRAESAASFLN